MTLTVLPLGVGDAFSARHYSCCVALGDGASWLLLDCPHPVRKMAREAADASGVALELADVHGVVLTHLHGDHASGLETYAYLCRFGFGRRARVACHPSVAARLWHGHLAAGMERMLHADGTRTDHVLEDWFEVTLLDERRAVDFGGFAVECRPTTHHIPTTAVRVTAGSASFATSADTVFDPQLIEWLAAADLFAHEAGLGVHTPLEALEALPAPLRARMRLIHYGDDVAPRGVAQLRQGVAVTLP